MYKRMILQCAAVAACCILIEGAHAQVPETIHYQGKVTISGEPYNAVGYFKFALIDESEETLWSNDGSSIAASEPNSAVQVNVNSGVFSVVLGDASIEAMVPLSSDTFASFPVFLRIWFDEGDGVFVQLTPDQSITATPYAMKAATLASDAIITREQIEQSIGLWSQTDDNLSTERRVGIGVSNPQDQLEVDGVIRAGSGWRLPDGNLITNINELIGPQGEPGLQGEPGPQGETGPQGEPGPQGPEGASPFVLGRDSISYQGGSVGIGLSAPQAPLQVVGDVIIGHGLNEASGGNAFVSGGGTDSLGNDRLNVASGAAAFVGGGRGNTASGDNAFVGGGFTNTLGGSAAFIGGGASNQASGSFSFVGGGENNIASGYQSFVAGGFNNLASGIGSSFVGGGQLNTASGVASFAAGQRAKSEHDGTFVWGDMSNNDFVSTAENQFLIRAAGGVGIGLNNPSAPLQVNGSIIAGYDQNEASGVNSFANGGRLGFAGNPEPNRASGDYSFVGGGIGSVATNFGSFIGGGSSNTAGGLFSFVGGGTSAEAKGDSSFIGGGTLNTSEGDYAFIGGGERNTADGNGSFIAGGWGNAAGGIYSFIGGGQQNVTSGTYSFAAGFNAHAVHNSTFVWADSAEFTDFESTAEDQFLIRAAGGVGINTNTPGDFDLAVDGSAAKPGGGDWSTFSDARLKHSIEPLAPGVLDRLLSLKGYSFEYKDEALENRLGLPGRQVGFMAQEVAEVFPGWVDQDKEGYLYVTERGTTTLLVEALRELRAERDSQADEIDRLRRQVAELTKAETNRRSMEERLVRIEALLSADFE